MSGVCCGGYESLMETNRDKIIVGGSKTIHVINLNSFQIDFSVENDKFGCKFFFTEIYSKYIIFWSGNALWSLNGKTKQLKKAKDIPITLSCIISCFDKKELITGSLGVLNFWQL